MLSIPLKHHPRAITNPDLKLPPDPRSSNKPKLTHMHHHPSLDLKNRITTQSNRELGEQRWQFLENRRESQLNAMFNRRKTILQSISRKNRNIYQRIVNQQGHYAIQKLGKDQLKNDSHRDTITLAERSKALLSMSRQALVNSLSRPVQRAFQKPQASREYQALIAQKQNICLVEQNSRLLQPISKNVGADLSGNKSQKEPKLVQSRYLESTSRTRPVIFDHSKIRACSVDRRRTDDIFVNF